MHGKDTLRRCGCDRRRQSVELKWRDGSKGSSEVSNVLLRLPESWSWLLPGADNEMYGLRPLAQGPIQRSAAVF